MKKQPFSAFFQFSIFNSQFIIVSLHPHFETAPFWHTKKLLNMLNRCLDHGVIGNTTGFGSVILGSSPGGPTHNPLPY